MEKYTKTQCSPLNYIQVYCSLHAWRFYRNLKTVDFHQTASMAKFYCLKYTALGKIFSQVFFMANCQEKLEIIL